MKKQVILIVLCLVAVQVWSQSKKDYIINFASIAVKEMETAKVPASITLAQGILESRFGMSELSTKSNNHFGIKCHNGWNGKKVYHDDDARGECFRAYKNAEDSFRDHSEFLTSKSRYADLFKLSIYDYKAWAKGLRKAGYATNPRYADHLIKIIEEEELYVFDRMTYADVGPYVKSLKNGRNTYFAKNQNNPAIEPKQNSVQTTSEEVTIIGGPAASPEDVAVTRDIFVVNDVRTVRTFEGDTPEKIAAFYDIPVRRLKKYNEWDLYFQEFQPGMKVYLQPKRTKSRDVSKLYHKVEPGETMYQIAQLYGIQTDKLYKRNLLNESLHEQPHPGEMISLRKNRDNRPKLLNKEELFSVENVPQQSQDPEVYESHGSQEDEEFVEEVINNKEEITPVPENTTEVITQKPVYQGSETTTSGNVEISTGDDPFEEGQYPSTEPLKKEESTVLNPDKENSEGRAIIYDPTPPVNQKPVEVYDPKPENTSSPTKNETPKNLQKAEEVQIHIVIKGDTLYSLSRKYGVTVDQIKDWNKLEENTIKLGQKLVVGK